MYSRGVVVVVGGGRGAGGGGSVGVGDVGGGSGMVFSGSAWRRVLWVLIRGALAGRCL